MEARIQDHIPKGITTYLKQFTGKHRPTIERVCACGCGETFKTTFPDKTTINSAHRKRLSRRNKNGQDPMQSN